jgi:hypothetical protein
MDNIQNYIHKEEFVVLSICSFDLKIVKIYEDGVEQIIEEVDCHPHLFRRYAALRHLEYPIQETNQQQHYR